MTAADRLATIRAGLDSGMSLRAIARSLSISDKTVRTTLRTAELSGTSEPAEIADYIAPGEGRVIPTPTHDEMLFQGGSTHPGKAWIACVSCGHPAWRDAPGVDAWTCGCPLRQCHGPRQVADADGNPQLVWIPYVIRPFPAALPPDK